MSDVTGFRLMREPLRAVLSVTGPFDGLAAASFGQLVDRCLDHGEPLEDIVVDLESSPFVTAAGFCALLEALHHAAGAGCRLHVEHLRPLVVSTFAALGLDAILC